LDPFGAADDLKRLAAWPEEGALWAATWRAKSMLDDDDEPATERLWWVSER